MEAPLTEHPRAGTRTAPARSDARSAWIALVAFGTLSLLAAVFSEGFLTGDACTHYLYSRFAISTPAYLVDVWGRPLVTALYTLPAVAAGRMGVRVTSLAIAVSCALLAGRLAREQGVRRPVLALLFTLGQPLLFLHSFSEMTELPFALVAGLAFWAYQRRRWGAMAALAGLLPLGRPEGFGFLLLAGAALVGHRRPRWLPLLVLPLVAWDYSGWVLFGRAGPWWAWLRAQWPWGTESLYGHGSLFSFVAVLPVVVSPLVLPATLVGMALSLRVGFRLPWHGRLARAKGNTQRPLSQRDHLRVCRVVTALIPLLVLLVHSVLYWLGKMASYGEARYLLVAAPFWGVLSARGWECLFRRQGWRHPSRWAALAIVTPIVANVVHPVVPIRPTRDWRVARQFATWYRENGARTGSPRLLAFHPGIFYYLDLSPTDPARTAARSSQAFATPPEGTLLVWDPIYSSRNADAARVTDVASLRAAGWAPDPSIDLLLNTVPGAATGDMAGDVPTSDPRAEWHVFRSPR